MAQEQTEETEEFRTALLPIMKPASRHDSNILKERGHPGCVGRRSSRGPGGDWGLISVADS